MATRHATICRVGASDDACQPRASAMFFASSRRPVVVRSLALVIGFASSVFVACSSDDEPKDEPKGDPADCRLIANRCHPYADGSNLAHECHEVGHEGESPAKCSEMRARCEAACPPVDPDAGTGGSGGSGGSGSGGTSPSGGRARSEEHTSELQSQ